MKINKILLVLGIVAMSTIVVAQPRGPSDHDRVQLNPQPLPPGPNDRHGPRDRTGDVMLNPQPLPPGPDRYRLPDRDHRRWNDRDHRDNFRYHRDHTRELRLGQSQAEVLALDWWQYPLFVRRNGRFLDYVYADTRHGRCVLRFRRNELVAINCR